MNAWEWHVTGAARDRTGILTFIKWMFIAGWRQVSRRFYFMRDAPLGIVADFASLDDRGRDDDMRAMIRESRNELALRIRRARKVHDYRHKSAILSGNA